MGGAVAGIGEALRSTRERRGLSIAEVAQDTRISPRFLEALEAEQFDELPAPVYVRGFIRSYASYLKIESQPLLDQLVGGIAEAGAPAGYVGGNGRTNGATTTRRNDPFQRHGVVPVAPKPAPRAKAAPPATHDDADSWSPEPPAPFVESPVDHGYIPGSDLMESPEAYEYSEEPVPLYRSRTAGVLAERPPSGGEPGIPRRVALFGAAVAAVLVFLALAVFLTRDDDGDGTTNAAAGGPTAQFTPSTVIPVGSRTTSPTASVSASAGASASVSATGSPSSTTTPGTQTPPPTTAAGTPTPTATATTSPTPTNTPPPATATPTTAPPTPVPTVGAPSHPSTIAACDLSKETEKCGSSYVRVICFPPFGDNDPRGFNDNYFVDVTGAYPLQAGWREVTVYAPISIGPVLNAGQHGCR